MQENIKKFINSNLFIPVIFILAFINFLFSGYIVFTSLLVIFSFFILKLDLDRRSLIPAFLIYVVGFKLPSNGINYYFYYGSMILIVLILTIDILKRKKINIKNPILYGYFTYLFAIILSVIASYIIDENSFIYAFNDLLRFIIWMLPIIYFLNTKDDLKDNQKYVSINMLCLMIFMLLQIFVFLINHNFDLKYIYNAKEITLCWSNFSTHIALLFMMCYPFILYLYLESKKKIFLLFALIAIIIPVYLQCRGSILALIPTFIISIIILFKKSNDKKKTFLDIIYCMIIPIIIIILTTYFTGILDKMLNILFDKGLDDNGRFILYKVGIENFIKHPIFGTGSHTSIYYLNLNYNTMIKNYHNIYLQILSCTGIFGFIMFIYFIICIIKEAFSTDNYNLMILLLILYLLIHGFVDTTFLNYRVMVLLSIILPFIKKRNQVLN